MTTGTYQKRTACKRGHPYRLGHFRIEIIKNSQGREYPIRRCMTCQNDWFKLHYRQDPAFRTKRKAIANAAHARMRAKRKAHALSNQPA